MIDFIRCYRDLACLAFYYLTCVALCLIVISCLPAPAVALEPDKLNIELSVGSVSAIEDKSGIQYRLVLGYDWAYTFATHEEVGFRMLGQGYTESATLTTVGLGTQYELAPKLNLFAEAGVGLIDYELIPVIVEEITYTQLVGTHAVEGRTIPFKQCYYGADCGRDYVLEIKDAPMFRVGVKWEPVDHILISISHRFMTSSISYEVFDIENRESGRGWWQERVGYDMGATELMIGYKW